MSAGPTTGSPRGRRVAIVTGAAQGIGAAIALRLAADGHEVAVLDLDEVACAQTADAVRASGREAMTVGVDVSDEDRVGEAVDKVRAELGPPTVLVNNAGVARPDLLHKSRTADWDLQVAVNLRGAYLLSRAVQPDMRQASWGRVVSLASTAVLGHVGYTAYAASKAGLIGFTKSLALELGRFGATANVVAPGFVLTAMTRGIARRQGVSDEAVTADATADSVVGRAGLPEDIAHAVAFFADERSGFVTGQVLFVAGAPRG